MLKYTVLLCLRSTRSLEFHSMATQSCGIWALHSPEESHTALRDSKTLHEWAFLPPHHHLLRPLQWVPVTPTHPVTMLGHGPTSLPLSLLISLPGTPFPPRPQRLLFIPQSWFRRHLLCEASPDPRSVLWRAEWRSQVQILALPPST